MCTLLPKERRNHPTHIIRFTTKRIEEASPIALLKSPPKKLRTALLVALGDIVRTRNGRRMSIKRFPRLKKLSLFVFTMFSRTDEKLSLLIFTRFSTLDISLFRTDNWDSPDTDTYFEETLLYEPPNYEVTKAVTLNFGCVFTGTVM